MILVKNTMILLTSINNQISGQPQKLPFFCDGFIPDISLANQRLTEWLIHNDFARPHPCLGYLTPFEFHQKYHKVLPMYPSRTKA